MIIIKILVNKIKLKKTISNAKIIFNNANIV